MRAYVSDIAELAESVPQAIVVCVPAEVACDGHSTTWGRQDRRTKPTKRTNALRRRIVYRVIRTRINVGF